MCFRRNVGNCGICFIPSQTTGGAVIAQVTHHNRFCHANFVPGIILKGRDEKRRLLDIDIDGQHQPQRKNKILNSEKNDIF